MFIKDFSKDDPQILTLLIVKERGKIHRCHHVALPLSFEDMTFQLTWENENYQVQCSAGYVLIELTDYVGKEKEPIELLLNDPLRLN